MAWRGTARQGEGTGEREDFLPSPKPERIFMKPVIMNMGKRAGVKGLDDRLNLQVMFPRASKSEMAEIDLVNGDNCQIIIRAPEVIEVHIERKP